MNIFDNDRINFMLDDLILEQGFVYTFDEDFNFTPCKDEAKIKRIKDAYVSYLRLNNYTISKNRIWDINYMDEL